MKLFIWRHNRKFHSYSMINEPNVHQDLYTDAVLIIAAETVEAAYELAAGQGHGWRVEELRRLEPKIVDCDREGLLFEDIRG